VKRDFFMEPPGWGKHARKFYLWGVCGSGKLTLAAKFRKVFWSRKHVNMDNDITKMEERCVEKQRTIRILVSRQNLPLRRFQHELIPLQPRVDDLCSQLSFSIQAHARSSAP